MSKLIYIVSTEMEQKGFNTKKMKKCFVCHKKANRFFRAEIRRFVKNLPQIQMNKRKKTTITYSSSYTTNTVYNYIEDGLQFTVTMEHLEVIE